MAESSERKITIISKDSTENSTENTVKMLIDGGADVNIVKMLIDGGANVNTVKMFIDGGANVNLMKNDELTALMLACRCSNSNSNNRHEVPENVARISVTIRTMLDDIDDCVEVDFSNIRYDIMERVLNYCQYRVNNPLPAEPKKEEWEIDEPKKVIEFTDYEKEICYFTDIMDLYQLILAANFLDIKCLLERTCKTVGDGLNKCNSVEEMNEYTHIVNDFTPEERAQNKADHAWVED